MVCSFTPMFCDLARIGSGPVQGPLAFRSVALALCAQCVRTCAVVQPVDAAGEGLGHGGCSFSGPDPKGGGVGGSDNKGDGMASQPHRYRVPGQPLLNRHQVGGVSRSPDGLFAQQEREPIRGRPAVRGKRTYGGRPGHGVEEQGTWASRTQKHSEAGYGRPVDRGAWTAKTVKRPRQQPAHPQYANYWAPLTPCHIQHSPNTPTTGLRERGNDTSRSTSRSGQQNAAT